MFKYIFSLMFVVIFSTSVIATPNENVFTNNNYSLIKSYTGLKIYKKQIDYKVYYVQSIDVNKARIHFVDWKKSNENFKMMSLTNAWSAVNNRAYSLTNGSFFDQGGNGLYNMSYPYKSSGVIKSMECSTFREKDKLKMLSLGTESNTNIFKYTAKVFQYDELLFKNNGYPDILVGLDPYFNKKESSEIGRTFVGVKEYSYQENRFSPVYKTHLVYILSSNAISQKDAINELIKLGVYETDIVMFDGSGSSQLAFVDNNNSTVKMYGCTSDDNICNSDKRSFPQAIAVLPR